MKRVIILSPSEKMDGNKKEGRVESELIRFNKAAREHFSFENGLEVSVSNNNGCSETLKVFQAFSEDIKKLRTKGISEEEIMNTGFVTTKIYKMLIGKANKVMISKAMSDTSFMIGADPEFLLFDDVGTVVLANSVLSKQGLIGNDGPMAELRPNPSQNPTELLENIKAILSDKKLTERIDHLTWKAACYHKGPNRDFSVGGHIHVGNPKPIMKMPREIRENLYFVLNKIMDELLSIPLMKLDGKKNGSTRRVGANFKFGSFGCLRTDWDRLEHRTLSGMWLMHPQIAEAVLGTAKAIASSAFSVAISKGLKSDFILPEKFSRTHLIRPDFDSWTEIPLTEELGCVVSSKYIKDSLDKSNVAMINGKFLESWIGKMKSLEKYSEYSKHINNLCEVLRRPSKFFADYSHDLKENWFGGKSIL